MLNYHIKICKAVCRQESRENLSWEWVALQWPFLHCVVFYNKGKAEPQFFSCKWYLSTRKITDELLSHPPGSKELCSESTAKYLAIH